MSYTECFSESESISSCQGSQVIRIKLSRDDMTDYDISYTLLDKLFGNKLNIEDIHKSLKKLVAQMDKKIVKKELE